MARELWRIGTGDIDSVIVHGVAVTSYDATDAAIRDVETREGLYGVPPARGANVLASGRSGELWVPKPHVAGAFVLHLWLGEATRVALEDSWNDLVRIIGKRNRLLHFMRTLPDGSVRHCYGEVVAGFAPEPLGQTTLRTSLEVIVPEGVWEDYAADTVAASAAGLPADVNLDMGAFAAVGTAPMLLRYIVEGPATNFRVATLRPSGEQAQQWSYGGAVGVGQSFQVDARTWAIDTTGGLAVDHSLFAFVGPRYLTYDPEYGTNILFAFGGGGASTRIQVTGRRRYYV